VVYASICGGGLSVKSAEEVAFASICDRGTIARIAEGLVSVNING